VYVPKPFRLGDPEAIAFMRSHPFAILVTVDDRRPVATHLPVQVHEDGEHLRITGHIASGNIQRFTFEQPNEAMVIFHGPHAYISSSWYKEEDVPTWNYVAVHAYGRIRKLSHQELQAELKKLLERYEGSREHGRLWHTFKPELLERYMKAVVGFCVDVTKVEGKAKMSQNRSNEDYQNIVAHLVASQDPREGEVAHWMQEHPKGVSPE
jgi:transcriptional regulator